MAEKDADKPAKSSAAAEPPKAVHIGGESLVDRLRPHIKEILIGTVVVAAVAAGFGIYSWMHERTQIANTQKLDRVLQVANEPVRPKDAKPDPKKPSFASDKERSEAILAEVNKQGDLAAGGPAYKAGLLFDAGKYDDAIAEYKKGIAGRTLEGALCREGVGLATEAKAAAEKDATARQKGLEDALAAFATMQTDETAPRYAYALYHQGRIQLLLGKKAEAKALFEKARDASKDGGDHEISELVGKRLAALGAS
jgi:tetratricopeptide (TPR) repeat protein